MERYINNIYLLLLIVIIGCNKEAEPAVNYTEDLSDVEQKLIGEWVYEYIQINNDIFSYADNYSTPGKNKGDLGGERAVLTRRWIYYSAERTYQLRWNRSEYQLGTDGEPNWQPNFGTWTISENSLIHNDNFEYSTAYTLELKNEKLYRTSNRIMSASYDNKWAVGDTVTYKEVFARKK
jgi:hypothetical protein